MGYECAQFTPPIYNDLLQGGDGTAEGLVVSYFSCMGWPTMLATSEQPTFIKKVCEGKTDQLAKLLGADAVPLRPGIKEVVADALGDSMQVALIAGTNSDCAEDVIASIQRQLGKDLSSKIRIFSCNPARGEVEGEQDVDEDTLSLKEATDREKKRLAADFVGALASTDEKEDKGTYIGLDSRLLASSNRRTVSPELLAALAATIGVRLADCVLIGASVGVTSAGCAASMLTIAAPRRFCLQGLFPGVAAKVEGFGSGYCSWRQLRSMLAARKPSLG